MNSCRSGGPKGGNIKLQIKTLSQENIKTGEDVNINFMVFLNEVYFKLINIRNSEQMISSSKTLT